LRAKHARRSSLRKRRAAQRHQFAPIQLSILTSSSPILTGRSQSGLMLPASSHAFGEADKRWTLEPLARNQSSAAIVYNSNKASALLARGSLGGGPG